MTARGVTKAVRTRKYPNGSGIDPAINIENRRFEPRIGIRMTSISSAAAMEKVATARHGKICGFGGVADAASAQRRIVFGMNFNLAGNDQTMFLQGKRARLAVLRGMG